MLEHSVEGRIEWDRSLTRRRGIAILSFLRRLGRPFEHASRDRAASRITPYFSRVGVIVVLGISAALMSFYRGVALREIEEVGERNTATIARYVATLVGPEAARALERPEPGDLERLQLKLARLRVNLGLKSISVQNSGGAVVASTTPSDIGRNLKDDEGFERAARGESASELVFRNRASRFERRTADADIVHSYVPLRADSSSPVAGVLEVYADVTALVSRMEFALTEIVVAGVVAFLLAYGVLVLVVKRAARTIDAQQREIEAKTALLRELSSQLQDNEERERQRLAAELHEGVAQTLAAVKYAVETATLAMPVGTAGPWPPELSSLVPTIQEAIRDVRSIATDLRPPGLDDFGLLRTLAALAGRLRAGHPELGLAEEYDVDEDDIPARLKIVVYRIVEAVLAQVASTDGAASAVRLSLTADRRELRLVIERQGAASADADTGALPLAERRAVVSGGAFSVRLEQGGDMTIVATWPRDAVARERATA